MKRKTDSQSVLRSITPTIRHRVLGGRYQASRQASALKQRGWASHLEGVNKLAVLTMAAFKIQDGEEDNYIAGAFASRGTLAARTLSACSMTVSGETPRMQAWSWRQCFSLRR